MNRVIIGLSYDLNLHTRVEDNNTIALSVFSYIYYDMAKIGNYSDTAKYYFIFYIEN